MILFLIFIILLFTNLQDSKWDLKLLDTGRDVSYLSDLEKDVILELNKVRNNPRRYANEYLVPMRNLYSGKYLQFPNETRIITVEGVKALNECITVLENTKPIGVLKPYNGLSLAARYHQWDQTETGLTGHKSSDGKTLPDRIEMYGKWNGMIGEVIDYGWKDAQRIVISLLVDDGVSSRGHRKNILDSSFHCVGVSFGEHKKYKYVCVIDLAQFFTDYLK